MSDLTPIGPTLTGAVHRASLNGHASHGAESMTEVVMRKPAPDRVELSDQARLLDRLRQLPDVRQNLVDRVKTRIAQGDYPSDETLSAAMDRMIDELENDTLA